MKQTDRNRLTGLLRDHVAAIAADLRAQMLAEGAVRQRARKLHADEQVGEDFDVWTDLLSRRAAVLWVLKSVYVRVLEDKGLLSPGRLFDPEAWQLFERLAPNLGETAFLRWIYRDLASPRGGLPELFGPQPAEVASPSDALSRDLIAFWRSRDPDTGHHWSFANERFDGELMGDLYQELDPTVKDRFALCQTPDFVREFILDRTLTPAIEEFGADTVRLLDPACGSGHFLIDGLKRLVEVTASAHPEWERGKVVRHALDRVVGIDLNDYACALARARLIMTAADLAGVSTLSEAAAFHPHVYWADGLEQVERGKDTRGQQLDLLDASKNEAPKASLSRPEVRAALRKVLAVKFHVVVANPPYITETDENRKSYHREVVNGRRRFLTAYADYGLVGPFIERAINLADATAYAGMLVANGFTKKPTGRPLVEEVLRHTDLSMIVDTSQTPIPHHGTPTLILLFRNRTPSATHVPVVMGKRRSGDAPGSTSWHSLMNAAQTVGYDDNYAYRLDLERSALDGHPWAFGTAGASTLKSTIEEAFPATLESAGAEIGRTTVCGAEPVYSLTIEQGERLGIPIEYMVPSVSGHAVRDWRVDPVDTILYPHEQLGGDPVGQDHHIVSNHLWRYRSLLRARRQFHQTLEERGRSWVEHIEHYSDRVPKRRALVHTFAATHTHFAYRASPHLYMKTAPALRLPHDATEYDFLNLLAYLNSSAACFWLKQVLHPKSHSSQKHHPDPSRAVFEFTASGLAGLPIPSLSGASDALSRLAGLATQHAERATEAISPQRFFDEAQGFTSRHDAEHFLRRRWMTFDIEREAMVAIQEEIDWVVYERLGIVDSSLLLPDSRYGELSCPRGERPFEVLHPRTSTVRSRGRSLSVKEAEAPPAGTLPQTLEELWGARVEAVKGSELLQQVETQVYKRAWRDSDKNVPEQKHRSDRDSEDLGSLLIRRLELWSRARQTPFSVAQATSQIQTDQVAVCVASALVGSDSFSLESVLAQRLVGESVPNHPFHTYTEDGLVVREAWEQVWELQRREDSGEHVGTIEPPPEYSQGSRGKPSHFLRNEYWKLRGKLDVPKERFIAFTEVPGRDGDETLYGWAGWTPIQRIRVMLGIDEDLEDDGVPLSDRIGLLDSAWRLLPDAEREDAATASRLRAELRATIGGDGFSKEQLLDWKKRFPPPTAARRRRRT